MKLENYLILFGLIVAYAGYVLANCEKDGKTYKVINKHCFDTLLCLLQIHFL